MNRWKLVIGVGACLMVFTMAMYAEELQYLLAASTNLVLVVHDPQSNGTGSLSREEWAVGNARGRGSMHQRIRTEVCPFREPGDVDSLAYWEEVNPGVAQVWRRQFTDNCNGSRFFRRYGIMDQGIAASLWAAVHNLWEAHRDTGRIFVMDLAKGQGPSNWMLRDKACADVPQDLWRCYFEPLTNCDHAMVRSIQDAVTNQHMDPSVVDHKLINNPNTMWAPWPVQPGSMLPWKYTEGQEMLYNTLLFALRLNRAVRREVADMLTHMFDSVPDFNPAHTIGMPLRGSDKCAWSAGFMNSGPGEMTCLSFRQYMEWAETIRRAIPEVNTIILTSEDYHNYIRPHVDYIGRGWRFILNEKDVLQGSGFLGHISDTAHVLSSGMAAAHAHLRAGILLLNQDSNFHMLIYRYLQSGCQIYPSTRVIFLNSQGGWKGCAAWSKEARCKGEMERRRNAGKAARAAWKEGTPKPTIPDLV